MTTGAFYKHHPTILSTEHGSYASTELHRLASVNGELELRCSQLVTNCKLLEEENAGLTSQLQKYAATLERCTGCTTSNKQ